MANEENLKKGEATQFRSGEERQKGRRCVRGIQAAEKDHAADDERTAGHRT